MPEKEDEEMLTVGQVCSTLKISRATVYNWIKKGKLNPLKENPNLERGPIIFKRSEVDALNKRLATND